MHICSNCAKKYTTEKGYLGHTCSVTGYKPTQAEHFGERFVLQSKKALERTGSLTPEKEADLETKRKETSENGTEAKVRDAHKQRQKKVQ